MKKLILTIASSLILAVSAQGASIQWYIYPGSILTPQVDGGGNLIGESGNLENAGLYFFFGSSSYADVLAAFDYGASSFDTGSVAGGAFLQDGTSHPGGGIATQEPPAYHQDISTSQLNDFFVVIVDPTWEFYKYVEGQQVGYDAEGTDPAEVMSWSSGDVQGETWQAIPEPGTMMLALAGVGVLWAKRRRAKKA